MRPRFNFNPVPGDDAPSPRLPVHLHTPTDKVHLHVTACALPAEAPPLKSKPASSADLLAAVRRLTQVCAETLATGPRLGLHPTPSHLLRIVDAALAESTDGPLPDWGTDIEGYFLQSLYEELIQQPANLYTGTRLLHGQEVPIPISTENWIECLNVFRAAILRGDVVVPSTKPTARYLGERSPGHVFVPVPGGDSESVDALRCPPEHLRAIKQWTRDILQLAEGDVVSINELACRDPGCPLLETIIAVFAEGVSMRWKLTRPGCAVTRTMLSQTLATAPR